MAAVDLAASISALRPLARAGPEAESETARAAVGEAGPANADYVELHRQVSELRSGRLDEREWRIRRQLEANGAVLVVLGIATGIGGLWFYAKFRTIAAEANIGATNAGRYVLAPPDLLSGVRTLRVPPSDGLHLLPLVDSAGLEAEPGARAIANGNFRTRPF